MSEVHGLGELLSKGYRIHRRNRCERIKLIGERGSEKLREGGLVKIFLEIDLVR